MGKSRTWPSSVKNLIPPTAINPNSPLIIFLLLFIPLLALRLALLIERHVPGHDTFFHILLFRYLLFNETILKGSPPQWFPYMAHGTTQGFWSLFSQSLLLSIIYPFANWFKNVNYLYIFQATLLIDELALLLGCLLLAHRYFRSLTTTIFVATAITYTAISSFQPYYDFHLIYMLPLTLYCLDRALRDMAIGSFFLAGLFGLVSFMGNTTYSVPFIWFSICIFYIMLLGFAPDDTIFMFKRFWQSFCFSWKHLLMAVTLVGLTAIIGLYLQNATTGVLVLSRSETGTVSVEEFLTYGSKYIGFGKYIDLLGRYPQDFNETVYSGLLVVPFAIMSLIWVRSRLSYAFGATALILILFGAGTFVSLIFYYSFPLAKFFRYIGLTTQMAKFFLIFYAGFGFEIFWALLRPTPHLKWENRPQQDQLMILTPIVTITIIFVIILIARLGWYPVFSTPYSFWFTSIKVPQYLTWSLLLSGVVLIIFVTIARWPRYAIIMGFFLLGIHVFDVLSLKFELEFKRTLTVSEAIVDMFETYDYKFTMQRGQDYNSNSRSHVFVPAFLEKSLVEGGQKPSKAGGPYGALYNTVDAFLFLDLAASPFRTDIVTEGIEAFHNVWITPAQRESRRVGFPMPKSVAYRKLSGFSLPKLQTFSMIHILPTDEDVTRVLAEPGFSGDALLASREDFASSGLNDSTVLKWTDRIEPQTNDRLADAQISVEEFTFDTLHVHIDNESSTPSVLYYADGWHPDWNALVNGKPTPVLRTNLGYKSVVIPPGQSDILFTFGNWYSRWLFRGIQLLAFLAFGSVFYLIAIDLTRSNTPSLLAIPDTTIMENYLPNLRTVLLHWTSKVNLFRVDTIVLKRTALIFGALYFFWQAFTFNWLEINIVGPLIKAVNPTSVLIPVGLVITTTTLSFSLALMMRQVNNLLFTRAVIIVGILSDLIILVSFNQNPSTYMVTIHFISLVAILWITYSYGIRVAYLAGIIVLVYAWLGTPVTPYTRQYLYEQGKTLYQAGEYKQAINVFQRAIEWNPADSDLHAWLARSYEANHQPDNALSELDRAIALNPETSTAYLFIANIYRSLGETNYAIDLYQKILAITPDDIAVRAELAKTYHKMGLNSEAQRELQKIIDIAPGHELAKWAQQELEKYR